MKEVGAESERGKGRERVSTGPRRRAAREVVARVGRRTLYWWKMHCALYLMYAKAITLKKAFQTHYLWV